MLQAIVTRYYGPGNKRQSRISARASAGRVFHQYDDRRTPDQNHADAARKLAMRMGWYGRYVGGALPQGDGGCVFVVETDDPRDSFFVGNES